MSRTPRPLLALAAVAFAAATAAAATPDGVDREKVAAEETRKALAVLKESSEFLAKTKAFAFDAEIAFDAVQETGQKLEFGGSRKALVRRPDRFRVDAVDREGDRAQLFFDGTTISAFVPQESAYVAVEKPGTINQAIDHIENDLGEPVPLADFLYADFYAAVAPSVQSGVFVGDETIRGHDCSHLAFRASGIDFGIWIDEGEKPVPRRVVITYPQAAKSPQFRATFLSWDFSPDTGDARFRFEAPDGAKRVPWAALGEVQKLLMEGQ